MNSDLQNKLFHFEADPPGEVWNKIADALDSNTEQTFPQRLFSYEEEPPVNTWQNIEASLDKPEPAIKVVPITKFRKPLRYVAAAASIIAIIFLATTINHKKTGAGSVIGGTETNVATSNRSSILPQKDPKILEEVQPKQPASSISNKEEHVEKQSRKKSIASIRTQNQFRSFSFNEQFIPKKADKRNFFDFSDQESYMVYSDEDGNAMKLPKKLFSLIHCQEEDFSCKERIQQLQQKLASTTITSDFFGILEILRQLQ